METVFTGYIRPKNEMSPECDFLLQPVFVVPVEIFSRGLLLRPQYRYFQAVVDASTGKTEFFAEGTVSVAEGDPPAGKALPAAIKSTSHAAALAESEAERAGREGWRALLGSAHALARNDDVIATWRVWMLSGNSMTDSLTARKIEGGLFLADFLNRAYTSDEQGPSRSGMP